MTPKHLQTADLRDRIIDVHAHLGVTLKGYMRQEYPYAQSLEDLWYRQRLAGVDAGVVFPFTPDLYFDPTALADGRMVPARHPASPVPYGIENELLLKEVFVFCPELQERYLPFVSVDPGREPLAQVDALLGLAEEYPFYGIKISPILCQSPARSLSDVGQPLLEFARNLDLPLLFHTTADRRETYSQPDDILRLAEENPDLRFCLAHCIGFDRRQLERADAMPNVWVDTSALKIQVQLACEQSPIMASPAERFPADYTDHRKVMTALAARFPETLVWGSDSPAYTYICRRRQAAGVIQEFRLKATYEDEKAALDVLPAEPRLRIGSRNTLDFIFGASEPEPGRA